MPSASPYRQLDEARILATLARLRARIAERFPTSSLARVADDLLDLGNQTAAFIEYSRRPHWPIRVGVGLAIAAMAVVLYAGLHSVRIAVRVAGVAEFVQAMDAAVSLLVFLGATVFFLVTLESRLKRHKTLTALHQLRSIAHIVDMHQLTKDPERVASPQHDTASSPERTLTAPQLGRYLDYCSELLSLISKIAALHVEHFNDPVVLGAVNEIESLTSSLSGKIWQKITLLDRG